ncbi:DUF6282 family protein [Paenibacillus radicis (ex Xue et al. 2023)]|uniref:DUF6282 family protein n=1 Tax=Paenibacillus radicis (ex Xue et al. 2023) TaxID=2972489 RepID=A0ABT1YIQ7_9BACL|nr:DUF6282 family protein [Paenibacillus radicis (ex Xue et al. 2023)]MCR8633067.1 DUF6282 family protein [Paenibacillus radicis (ex Xue et al. 2023)]
MNKVDLNGIIDLHVHSAPDVKPRSHDDFQLAEQAVKLGARALVIKSHLVPTMDRAKLVNQKHPEVRLFGSITLNPPVGGINPHAVETAFQLGAKTVWLPTVYSARHRQMEGKSGGIDTVVNRRIVPPLKDVLKLIAENNGILGTGHLSAADIFVVVEEARKQGVRKIVVTHPESYSVGMTLEDQRKMLEQYGVWFERVYAQPAGRGRYTTNLAVNLQAIKELGYESTIIATDGGQIELPSWSNMLTEYIQYLSDHGITAAAIDRMTKFTPAELLDLT